MNKVYIASPLFNEEQINTIKLIEIALEEANIDYFSPRSEGVLVDMSEEERKKAFSNMYKSNVVNMDQCNVMIAVIDDRDVGTAYELGWFKSKPVFSFSNFDYQINIMLREAVCSHNTNIVNLITNIKEHYNGKKITKFDELTKDVT